MSTTARPEPSTSEATTSGSDDEWEETTLVVEVNGVLDAQMVRNAVSTGQVNLRRAETEAPILQLSNSLYTGKWMRSVGTDIILQSDNGSLKIVSATDLRLKTEKALLTANCGRGKEGSENSPGAMGMVTRTTQRVKK